MAVGDVFVIGGIVEVNAHEAEIVVRLIDIHLEEVKSKLEPRSSDTS